MFLMANVSPPITPWVWLSRVVSLCSRSVRRLATRAWARPIPRWVRRQPFDGSLFAPGRLVPGADLAGGLALQRPQFLLGLLQLARRPMTFQLVAVGVGDHEQVLHSGVDPHHRGTGFHMRRPAGVALHQAGQRHQPTAPLEPDRRLQNPGGAGLDPASQLAGGLVRLDRA